MAKNNLGKMLASQRDWKSTGLGAGEETERAMWRGKIISHTSRATLYGGKSLGMRRKLSKLFCNTILAV